MTAACQEECGAAAPLPRAAWRRGRLLLAPILLGVPAAALAAEGAPSGSSLTVFIAQLGVLLLVGRLMGEAAQRIGQPHVMGQLIGGLLLGPSVLGALWPQAQHALFPSADAQKNLIEGVAQLGILMLLLLTGMETDLQLVRRVGRTAVIVAIAGVAIPFACGMALGELLPESLLPKPDARLVTALFLGIALSISSVKIVAMVVREMNFMRRDIGQIIVASAILEDTIGWVIIAVAFGLASAGTIDIWSVGRALIGTAAFLAASLTIGRRIVFQTIRWANDSFQSDFPVVTTILLIMIGMALLTQAIGVNMVLGAFVAGILAGESPIRSRHIDEQLRGLVAALFMPVFFGLSGLSANLTILKDPKLAALGTGLVLIACIGKFAGAFVGGKLGGLVRSEALALACAMNARGSTEVIVASLGLSMGILSQNLFTLIVGMAVITTMSMPPMLRWALKRLPMRDAERIRLEREEIDARGFVTNLERLLLAVDDSRNGKYAAQLAGIISGSSGKPTTVLELASGEAEKKTAKAGDEKKAASDKTRSGEDEDAKSHVEESAQEVKSAAERVTTLETHPEEERPGSVDVTTVRKAATGPESVAEEARKGYDLLVIGVADTRDPKGGFGRHVSLIAQEFEGALAVVAGPEGEAARLFKEGSKILIPVNGTDVSRRAAEIGFTVARATDADVTVLYVTRSSGGKGSGRAPARGRRRQEVAVLKDIGALAERYDLDVRRSMRADSAPDEAIIREAKRGYDLIVLGANRRPGDTLFFGNTAAAVLDRAETSKLFVAS
jgi:Kef-type K+ transport system membrane component KefB/nucleotide-binding universal stress UspA family protein